MKTSVKILFLFLFILGIQSCNSKEETPLKIALSKGYPAKYYQNYYDWIKSADSTILVTEMYNHTLEEALSNLENCDALIVTGGADVYPGNYGKEKDTSRCGQFDFKRDTLEFALIKKALELNMPIFGICRGEQILNIALGGSLFIDIPTDYDTTIKHRIHDWQNCYHAVCVEPGTKFAQVTNVNKGNVTSNHHQAIDRLAKDLRAAARSTDGLIEAVEWKEPKGKSFLMAVQWHPERMNKDNPLSWNLLEFLIDEAKRFSEQGLD
jgi:putative glutamine amidotransferase